MANSQGTRGGSSEQHAKAGEQSHKTTGSSHGGGTQGGTHEQHVKAGEQSHKNTETKSEKSGEHGKSSHESHKKS